MRLYTTTGASQVDDPEFGTFKADANGAFDGLPDGMYAKLHGRPGWENDPERELRITREELDRFRDPAELLKAVKELGANQGVLAAALAQALGIAQAPAPTDPATPASETSADAQTQTPEPVRDVVPETPSVEVEESPVKVDAPAPVADVKPKAGRRGKAALAAEAPPGE